MYATGECVTLHMSTIYAVVKSHLDTIYNGVTSRMNTIYDVTH